MTTTKHRVVNGVRYAEGVEPAPEGESDPDFLAQLSKKPKIRITTMVDMDVYEALKKAALKNGDGRYQTYLNQLLRETLFGLKVDLDLWVALNEIKARLEQVEKRQNQAKKATPSKHRKRA